MDFNPKERIALFIDGANLYAAAKSLGFDIDFKRLLEFFRQKGQLVRRSTTFSSIRPRQHGYRAGR